MHKILVIDDNVTEIQSLVYAMELAGYQVLYARRGEVAVDLARTHTPALILCDIMMPGMDGFDVAAVLKRDPRTRTVPVVFLTARRDDEAIIRGFGLDADDFIKKPYNLTEVLLRIKRILHKRMRHEPAIRQYGQLRLNPIAQMAFIEERQVYLSLKEMLILSELIDHPEQTVTVRHLAMVALGARTPTRADRHTIATHVYNLRHKKLKLEATRATDIVTDGHRGYRLISRDP